MILIVTEIHPHEPAYDERLSICGLAWVAYFLTLALVIGRLA